MNFHTLEYFTVLAQERNFTRAAESLHITQQSLSARIAALERELNCQLLVRRVPLELTYAGRVFLRYATDIRMLQQNMYEELCDISQNQKGELRIGIAFTRGRSIMPQLITAFQAVFPAIQIYLTETSNESLQKLLIDGKIDLAVARFPRDLPEVELHDFYREHVILLIPNQLLPGTSESRAQLREDIRRGELQALKDCPFLLGNSMDIAGSIGRSLIQRSGIQPPIRVKSDNMETLLALCAQGAGACFAPENLVRAVLAPQQLAAVESFPLPKDAAYSIRFGVLSRSYQWKILSEFIRISRETYPSLDT